MSGINGSTPGIDLGAMYENGMDALQQKGSSLQTKMDALMSQEEISPEEMMMVQFEMGQYNATLEAFSSITKSLTDSLKSLAQRAG